MAYIEVSNLSIHMMNTFSSYEHLHKRPALTGLGLCNFCIHCRQCFIASDEGLKVQGLVVGDHAPMLQWHGCLVVTSGPLALLLDEGRYAQVGFTLFWYGGSCRQVEEGLSWRAVVKRRTWTMRVQYDCSAPHF